MFELPSAMFSIADGNEFRFARFYIVCEAIRLEALESPLIVCACRTFPAECQNLERQGICCLVRAAVFCYNGERKRGGSRVKIHFSHAGMEIFMEKKRRLSSLKKKIIVFVILCWGVPIAVFFAYTTSSYRKGIIEKTEGLMEDQLENMASFASIRIEDAITLCQRPSYEKTWENAWKKYLRGDYSRNDYLQDVYTSLRGKFYLDERFNMYAYYCYGTEDPESFSSRTGISLKSYVDEIQPYLKDIIDSDSAYACVRVVDGRIFIVRNLYTTMDYTRYGTLVVELNRSKVFQDVDTSLLNDMVVCFGSRDARVDFVKNEEMSDKEQLLEQLLQKYDGVSNRTFSQAEDATYRAYLYQERRDDFHIGIVLFARKSELYSGLYQFYTIVALMFLLLIPLFGYVVYFIRRNIQHPIDRMLRASGRMEAGEMGITVEGEMPNQEFMQMKESFDSMSAQVKYLFDSMYSEKLARKDAQIQALQAQINPHFLNNTLEMMNWQARMSGDTVVSKMIESLGTVLDYRMNRANVKEIHLAEELQCIDAYFYIMSMRFGQRLSIERKIDDDLLYLMVPPLILQPIVENAIVHGVETVKNGVIRLYVYHDEENVYLKVRNTGKKMTEEELERIHAILEGDESKLPKNTGRHTSIGIQNVNRRIRLVYGDEYGLSIEQEEDCITVSTITIPYVDHEDEISLKERSEAQNELKNIARLNK